MTTILTTEQIDLIRDSCTATTYGVPQTLDSGTFQALATSGLNLSKATPLICTPGQIICREGESGDAMFLIRSGHAAIVKGSFEAPIVLACRGAGEFIGEMALLENLPRSASVVALDEVYLYHVTRDDFQRMLSHSTKLDIGMLRKFSSRLREADDLITTTTHARRSLSSQVNVLAAENQQLMELQRLREQTTDLVVHDLRNPLHSIMGATGMLQMILPPNLLQENRDLFKLVNDNCERMQRLVDSLLDISRMESGETELALEPVNLAQLIQSAVSRVSSTLQIARYRLQCLHARAPAAGGDRSGHDRSRHHQPARQRHQVHAERRTDQRGRRSARRSRGGQHHRYGLRHSARTARRTSSSASRAAPTAPCPRGFGLGLTFCKLAVEAHGGQIWVEDGEGGVGCKSIFTLPLIRVA